MSKLSLQSSVLDLGDITKEEISGLQNELYVYLLDIVHDILKPPAPSAPSPLLPSSDKLRELLSLANEYVISGSFEAAEKKHQERLAAREDPQVRETDKRNQSWL